MSHQFHPSLPPLVFALFACGCAPAKDLTDICEWVKSPAECDDTGETGVEPEEEPPPCTVTNDGHIRTVYQCEGEFTAAISFKTIAGDCAQTLKDDALCTEVHTFGPLDEPYEMPAVMACCDPDAPPTQDELVEVCAVDAIEQLCRSVPARLQRLIDDGKFPIGELQAKNLRNWLAANQQTCFSSLYEPTNVPGVLAESSWLVNDGKNGNWPLLKDFTITLQGCGVESAWLPDVEDEYLACNENDYNNTEIFEAESSSWFGSTRFLVESPQANVSGPELLGGQISASGRFASLASGCTDPWCSSLAITTEGSSWRLDELELFGDGPLVVTHRGIAVASLERVAIRLYGSASGTVSTQEVHTLLPGAAHFVISGIGDDSSTDLRWGSNSSPITITAHDGDGEGGWVVQGFNIKHVDRTGLSWTIFVPPTTWN